MHNHDHADGDIAITPDQELWVMETIKYLNDNFATGEVEQAFSGVGLDIVKLLALGDGLQVMSCQVIGNIEGVDPEKIDFTDKKTLMAYTRFVVSLAYAAGWAHAHRALLGTPEA